MNRECYCQMLQFCSFSFCQDISGSGNDSNKGESVSPFRLVSQSIQRSELTCYMHWHTVLLPILKTHELGLSQSHVWQNDVMKYIVQNEISSIEDVDFQYLENKLCPGQTLTRIKVFVRSLTMNKIAVKGKVNKNKNKIIRHNQPLYEVCVHRLKCRRTAGGFAKNKSKQKQERIKEIVNIYNTLSKQIQ